MGAWRVLRIVVVLAVMGALAVQCRPHPVGPARTFAAYEGKARTTAETALAQVETVRLAVRAADRGNAFSSYLAELVGEAEDALGGLQDTFGSIQPPPGDDAEQLADAIDQLLGDAEDHVTGVRVAVRRGTERGLGAVGADLDDDAKALRAFLHEHEG